MDKILSKEDLLFLKEDEVIKLRGKFVEIKKEDAVNLMKESIKYYKRTDGTYVRRVYNVYVESLDPITLEWKNVSDEWDKDMFFDGDGKVRVSKNEIDSYITSSKTKKYPFSSAPRWWPRA